MTKDFMNRLVSTRTDAELEMLMQIITDEMRTRKLAEYNRKLHELMAAASADGIRFIYIPNDSNWCETLSSKNVEAAC